MLRPMHAAAHMPSLAGDSRWWGTSCHAHTAGAATAGSMYLDICLARTLMCVPLRSHAIPPCGAQRDVARGLNASDPRDAPTRVMRARDHAWCAAPTMSVPTTTHLRHGARARGRRVPAAMRGVVRLPPPVVELVPEGGRFLGVAGGDAVGAIVPDVAEGAVGGR